MELLGLRKSHPRDDPGPATCRELSTRCSPGSGWDNQRISDVIYSCSFHTFLAQNSDIWARPESGAVEQKPHVPSGALEKWRNLWEDSVKCTASKTLLVCYCRFDTLANLKDQPASGTRPDLPIFSQDSICKSLLPVSEVLSIAELNWIHLNWHLHNSTYIYIHKWLNK